METDRLHSLIRSHPFLPTHSLATRFLPCNMISQYAHGRGNCQDSQHNSYTSTHTPTHAGVGGSSTGSLYRAKLAVSTDTWKINAALLKPCNHCLDCKRIQKLEVQLVMLYNPLQYHTQFIKGLTSTIFMRLAPLSGQPIRFIDSKSAIFSHTSNLNTTVAVVAAQCN